ncbi:hypothetical protein EMCRGX_G030582 [Ephydatia muelleri]
MRLRQVRQMSFQMTAKQTLGMSTLAVYACLAALLSCSGAPPVAPNFALLSFESGRYLSVTSDRRVNCRGADPPTKKATRFYLSFYPSSAYFSFRSVKFDGEFIIISNTGNTSVGLPGGNRTASFEGINTNSYTSHVAFRASNSCYLAFDADGNSINSCVVHANDTKTWFNFVQPPD